jgi:hypothetical protein
MQQQVFFFRCSTTYGKKDKFPKEWKEGIVIKVSKKEHLSQCRNWRGVTLLVVISKIFNKIILERVKNSLGKGMRKEQAGFRHNRSCIDQINTLRVIIDNFLKFVTSLHVVCVLSESF